MNDHKASISDFENRVKAQLHETKTKINELDTHAKDKAAQAKLDGITDLHKMHEGIEKKVDALKTSHEAKAEVMKADIKADLSKLKTSVDALHEKIKHSLAAK